VFRLQYRWLVGRRGNGHGEEEVGVASILNLRYI
jgi:hypothetical protein